MVLPDTLNDKEERQEALRLFREDENFAVLLMSSNPTAEGFEELSIPEATVARASAALTIFLIDIFKARW